MLYYDDVWHGLGGRWENKIWEGEIFEAKPKYPSEMSDTIKDKILGEFEEEIYIFEYLGVYNGMYAFSYCDARMRPGTTPTPYYYGLWKE